MTKTQISAIIKKLPNKFSIEELFDKIILLQKIETGLEQSAKGETFSTQTAKKKLKKWLK